MNGPGFIFRFLSAALPVMLAGNAFAQEVLPWERQGNRLPTYGAERGYGDQGQPNSGSYANPARTPRPAPAAPGSSPPGTYASPRAGANEYGAPYQAPYGGSQYNRQPRAPSVTPRPYDSRSAANDAGGQPPSDYGASGSNGRPVAPPYDNRPPAREKTYSQNEIVTAGHKFFGSVSKGLAKAVEYAFKKAGRPNGYILGEDAGGAFVAGLRYGEGVMYTKDRGAHRIYWQGPSIGYDFGAEGSKVMVLVYNLRSPREIYSRFGGIQGSAYLVGGVGVQFLKRNHVTVAPIRAGVGLRFGANVGYLKYTRRPTWNPF